MPAVRGLTSRDGLTAWLLVAPAAVCIVFLFVVPIGYVLLLSVTDPTVSLEHYRRLLTVPLYANVMLNTFKTSFIVTLACLALGYPLAYVMARRNDAIAVILLVVVGLSFWTGFVVRTYAWLVILGNKGPVAATYALAGWGKPPQLLFTSFSSTLGMTEISSLPTNARRYIEFLSQQIGVEIGLVSTGPERMQTIIVQDSALGGWLRDSK